MRQQQEWNLAESMYIDEIEKLKAELETTRADLEAEKAVVDFYAHPSVWIKYNKDGSWSKCSPREKGDSELVRNYQHEKIDCIGTIDVGGKRARERQAQRGGE